MTEKFDFGLREKKEDLIDDDALGMLIKEFWKAARLL